MVIFGLVLHGVVWADENSDKKSGKLTATEAVATDSTALQEAAGEAARVTAETETIVSEGVLASAGAGLIDIGKIKADPFVIKREGFEETGQSLGRGVDQLQEGWVSTRRAWLKSTAVAGISWLKLLFGLAGFILLALFDFVLRHLILRQQKHLGADAGNLRVLAKAGGRWFNPLLEAIRKPLSLFIWTYGGLTLISFLFSHVTSEEEISWVPRSVGQAAELGGLVALFWALIRSVTVLDIRLKIYAETTPSKWDNILVPFVGKCLRLILPIVLLILSLPLIPLSLGMHMVFQQGITILLICSFSWILINLILVIEASILHRYGKRSSENFDARRIFTQVHLMKRVILTILVILTLATILMVFESVRRLGTSILASAGVLGIIIGLAAQRTISTLLAGIQIAFTQPIRIDDVVIVEGEWGWIEEITLTYVVVKIWDLRRLVLPINYFIEKPFQNWTRTSAKILGTIYFYVDYRLPVDELREPLKRFVAASPHWDKDVCGLQVTNTGEKCVELRALVSADDSSKAWDLRCEVREKLLKYIQDNYPSGLPQVRASLEQLDTAQGIGTIKNPA
jgi:small-conductance mechanosensitive channel